MRHVLIHGSKIHTAVVHHPLTLSINREGYWNGEWRIGRIIRGNIDVQIIYSCRQSIRIRSTRDRRGITPACSSCGWIETQPIHSCSFIAKSTLEDIVQNLGHIRIDCIEVEAVIDDLAIPQREITQRLTIIGIVDQIDIARIIDVSI